VSNTSKLQKPAGSVDQTEVLITRVEAAKWLKVSVQSLKRWEKSRYLTGVRCGPRLIRYHLSEIQAMAGGAA